MFTETENRNNYLFWLLIVFLIFGFHKYKVVRQENEELKDEVSSYQSALEEANSNIEEANSNIEDAQSSAWSDYDEMGDALDNLSTVDTVPEP